MNKRRDFRMAEVIRFILFNYTMEQTLQQQWEKVLQSLLEIVQNGLDKAPDYVLDFFNRFQTFIMWSKLFIIFMLIIASAVFWYIIYRLNKIRNSDSSSYWRKSDATFWIGAFLFWIMVMFILILVQVYQIIQVSTVPEISLIEFLQPEWCK